MYEMAKREKVVFLFCENIYVNFYSLDYECELILFLASSNLACLNGVLGA
ncbi:hypothetical protein HanRHA438_Chr11g0500221 [Helianthus annuus]|nr:hypothetical protein HanRHA438_Chr11g0500221 [Helianthus annuus]